MQARLEREGRICCKLPTSAYSGRRPPCEGPADGRQFVAPAFAQGSREARHDQDRLLRLRRDTSPRRQALSRGGRGAEGDRRSADSRRPSCGVRHYRRLLLCRSHRRRRPRRRRSRPGIATRLSAPVGSRSFFNRSTPGSRCRRGRVSSSQTEGSSTWPSRGPEPGPRWPNVYLSLKTLVTWRNAGTTACFRSTLGRPFQEWQISKTGPMLRP